MFWGKFIDTGEIIMKNSVKGTLLHPITLLTIQIQVAGDGVEGVVEAAHIHIYFFLFSYLRIFPSIGP